jgi:Protein of unknown function (DUF1194)
VLRTGPNSKISVTYFEWSESSDQKIIIPWRVFDGPETADAVARQSDEGPALRFLAPFCSRCRCLMRIPKRGGRRVIDISGDGPNNNGPPVTPVRDEALAKGIVINGLPIMVKEPSYSTMDIDNLDWYYEDCVIGGSGSFVVPIKDRDNFKEAIRTKLLLEVAGKTPEPRLVPASDKELRISCLIGEKLWQDR